jgi:hypothetical protein
VRPALRQTLESIVRVVCLIALGAVMASAQPSGQLTGVVRDTTGSVRARVDQLHERVEAIDGTFEIRSWRGDQVGGQSACFHSARHGNGLTLDASRRNGGLGAASAGLYRVGEPAFA